MKDNSIAPTQKTSLILLIRLLSFVIAIHRHRLEHIENTNTNNEANK